MMSQKRKLDSLIEKQNATDGDVVLFKSFNFQPMCWGFKSGSPCMMILRAAKNHQMFRIVPSSSQGKSLYLQALGGRGTGCWLLVDPNTREMVLSAGRTSFRFEEVDTIGNKVVVRLCTKEGYYVRHSNYLLRVDPRNDECDKPWAEDTLWILEHVSPNLVGATSPTPIKESEQSFSRPLFIHIKDCISNSAPSIDHVGIFREFIWKLMDELVVSARSNKKTISYPLQGAGGMGMDKATAISMARPGPPLSDDLKRRVESATTVKSRGGVSSFLTPTEEIAKSIVVLARIAMREMKRLKMFGLNSRRDFDLELGFCEWVHLPHGSEIVPHRDGGSDCDVAAIFCIQNRADCTVESTTITLDEGDMYIFEPQKYMHSVSCPQLPGPRNAVALRFFRVS